jgi:hypothetical protein
MLRAGEETAQSCAMACYRRLTPVVCFARPTDSTGMAQSRPARLLTTRWRTGVSVALTACVFVLAIRDVLVLSHRRGLLLPLDFLLHGWPLVAANVVFYGYLCPRARAGFYNRMVLSRFASATGTFAASFHRGNQVHLRVRTCSFVICSSITSAASHGHRRFHCPNCLA